METDVDAQPLAIARALAAIQEREQAGMVIFGKQSIDGDNSQTGQMFAALTGMPSLLPLSGTGRWQGPSIARNRRWYADPVCDAACSGYNRPAFERTALRVSAEHYESEEKTTGRVHTPEDWVSI